jgi:hypothetical protein
MPFANQSDAASADLDPNATKPQEEWLGYGVDEIRRSAEKYGPDSPVRYLEILKAYPIEHEVIMQEIHRLFGIEFAGKVKALYKQSEDDGLVDNDDGLVVDTPPIDDGTVTTPLVKDEGIVDPDPGIIQDEELQADGRIEPDDGTVDTMPDPGIVDGFNHVVARPEWVKHAEAFNRAHSHDVDRFNDATKGICRGIDGELDPVKVAEWQLQYGLHADGRVTQHTVEKAIGDTEKKPPPTTSDPNEKTHAGG